MSFSKFSNVLNRATDQLTNRGVLKVIGQAGVADAEDCFELESDPNESPWESLSKNTLANRRSGQTKIGVVTGRLLRSLTFKAFASSVAWGTNVLYGFWFHHGTKKNYPITAKSGGFLKFKTANGWVRTKSVTHPGLKPRPFVGVGERLWKEIRAIVGNDVAAAFDVKGNFK